MPELEKPENETKSEASATDEEISKIINSAVTNHLKRALPKALEQALAPLKEQLSKPKDETPKDETPKDESKASSNPELAELLKRLEKQDRTIKEISAREKAAIQKANSAAARNQIAELVKGKLLPDWQDIAIDRLMQKVSFDNETPEYDLGEFKGNLQEGVESFLKDATNKRFLPAPKAAVKQTQTNSYQQTQSSNQSNGIPSAEDCAQNLANALASGDIQL